MPPGKYKIDTKSDEVHDFGQIIGPSFQGEDELAFRTCREDLIDIMCDLSHFKGKAHLLGSLLHQCHLLRKGVKMYTFRKR